MDLDSNVGGRDRLVRATLAALFTVVAIRSLRGGRRTLGLLAGAGALGFGFICVRTVALTGFEVVPGMTRTSVMTCPRRSRPSLRASSARRKPMYSLGWVSSLASRMKSIVSRAMPRSSLDRNRRIPELCAVSF